MNINRRRSLNELNRTKVHQNKHSLESTENDRRQKELSPFKVDRHADRLRTLIFSNFKSSGVPVNKDPNVMLEISEVVCQIIFATPVAPIEQVEKCRTYSYRLFRNSINVENLTLMQVLVEIFIKNLCKRFTYKERLKDLLKNRQIPAEKKEKWLLLQYEQQGKLLKETDSRSLLYIRELFHREHVYQVLEALIKVSDNESLVYDYMNAVLTCVLLHRLGFKVFLIKTSSFENDEKLKDQFQKIMKLAEENGNVPLQTRNLLTKHWNDRFETKK